MFIGNWIINICFSLIAFFIVFLSSMSNNTITTSIYRSFLAFIFFFIITYFFRWLWMIASKETEIIEEEPVSDTEQPPVEAQIGGNNLYKEDLSEEEIQKASQYVKDLINE